MNTYLENIINNYITFELKFKNELLDVTEHMIDICKNWHCYDTYIICSENYSGRFAHCYRGEKINVRCIMHRCTNRWYTKLI